MGGVVSRYLDKIRYTALSKLSKNKLNWMNVEKNIKLHQHRYEKGLISSYEFWKLVANDLGIEDYNKVKKIFIDSMIKMGRVNEDVVQFARELKKKGYKVGILSNTCETDANIHKKRGDYKLFSPVILSHELGYAKPEEKIYLIALERLKVKPNECVFIDDKEINLKPARKLGIKTILFKSPAQMKKELNKLL